MKSNQFLNVEKLPKAEDNELRGTLYETEELSIIRFVEINFGINEYLLIEKKW